MNPSKARAELAADPDLGVGNVLSTLVEREAGLDEPAITFDVDVDGHPAWQPLTLRQLYRSASARAAWLAERGVQPRDPVAIYVTSAADQVLSFLALTRIGAIPALVNRNVDGRSATTYIERLRPAALLTDAEHRAALAPAIAGPELDLDVTESAGGDPERAPKQFKYHAEDIAVITHSSGTTGLPKA